MEQDGRRDARTDGRTDGQLAFYMVAIKFSAALVLLTELWVHGDTEAIKGCLRRILAGKDSLTRSIQGTMPSGTDQSGLLHHRWER